MMSLPIPIPTRKTTSNATHECRLCSTEVEDPYEVGGLLFCKRQCFLIYVHKPFCDGDGNDAA